MSKPQLSWGNNMMPEGVGAYVAFGARTIKNKAGVEFLPDRQGWWCEYTDETNPSARKACVSRLQGWLLGARLTALKKWTTTVGPDSEEVYELNEGDYHLRASPCASYGYVYIAAWIDNVQREVPK